MPRAAATLAFYSHVETDVRELAEQAGFELVVPRSRMAREGGALVERLVAAARDAIAATKRGSNIRPTSGGRETIPNRASQLAQA